MVKLNYHHSNRTKFDSRESPKIESTHARKVTEKPASKATSTVADALPQLVEAETGRVHTDFNQAVMATGRPSSSNPNLQNIPVRTEYSRRIRKAFLPQKSWTLLSANYSQIELRILTHLSGEDMLQQAYRPGNDMHALTARLLLQMHDELVLEVDPANLDSVQELGVLQPADTLLWCAAIN